MTRRTARRSSALTFAAGGLLFASESRADDVSLVTSTPSAPVVVEPAPATDTVRTRTESAGPDMREIGGGLVTFGISYGVALGVAATSGHQGDSHLYVPLVGPWLDFGDRGSCPPTGSCDKETTYRVLIVADGIFQALGALSVLSGFLFPTTREVTTTTTAATAPTFDVKPVQYAHGGLGLAAVGRF